MTSDELPPLTPELYGEGPAREPHIPVVERWAECHRVDPDDPEHELEFFHRQMNEEANVLENAASSLARFPDADWSIRMFLARQCSDEARHVQAYMALVRRRGGRIGQFPVMNFQYRILQKIDSLVGRLTVQNRTFEADGLDAVTQAIVDARDAGDDDLAAMYEAQQCDEILHVGFANEWIRREINRDPRQALQMATALTRGSKAFQEVFAGGGTLVSAYGVAAAEREAAGFGRAEIEVMHEVAEQRRAEARSQALAEAPDRGNA